MGGGIEQTNGAQILKRATRLRFQGGIKVLYMDKNINGEQGRWQVNVSTRWVVTSKYKSVLLEVPVVQ